METDGTLTTEGRWSSRWYCFVGPSRRRPGRSRRVRAAEGHCRVEIRSAEVQAGQILEQARRDAEAKVREALVEVKEEAVRLRQEAERR